ncbi:HmuY family protein [Gynuella sunshinyii]|uniref:HmuY protein n=1 Tax=Gynuella sunshinyii YC6258 TaxID=1445510 RepID=A0A0C5VKT1_9GAMM|nr:HmuY family protein [Gynuella sunshinyii]AJQ94911.1 hypothetical Protein YC6258_02873 [Gynuella sunshinyii YC6258]
MKFYHTCLLSLCVLGLTACSSESEDNDGNADNRDSSEFSTLKDIDANSSTLWTYVNLDSATTVTEDDEWQLAFKRYEVRVNPDLVSLALAASQDDFYNSEGKPIASVFTNATANSELEHLLAEYDFDAMTFNSDTFKTAIGADGTQWYDYDRTTHLLSANDDAWWIIRNSTATSFAKLRVATLSETLDSTTFQFSDLSMEIEFYIQGANDDSFATTASTWTLTAASAAVNRCYDIDSSDEVDCSSDGWDIQADIDFNNRKFDLILNGGVSGSGYAAAYGALNDTGISAYSSASALNVNQFVSDSWSNAFNDEDNKWWAYGGDVTGLESDHALYPNYRVYALSMNDSDQIYLVQVVSYYHSSSAQSANPSIRYVKTTAE